MPPPLCGLNWHSAGGGRRGGPEAETPLPPAPLSPPSPGTPSRGPRRRRQPACAWGSGSRGSAPGRPAPGDALCSGCRLPAHCGAVAAGGPSARRVLSARRTPIPVRGADPAEDPGETFLSRGERARPGAARGMRYCARRRRGPGPGARAGAGRLAGEWPARGGRGGGDRAARGGGDGPRLPTRWGRDRAPGGGEPGVLGRLRAGLGRGAGITTEAPGGCVPRRPWGTARLLQESTH